MRFTRRCHWPIKLMLVVMIGAALTPTVHADCRRVVFTPAKKVIVHEPAVTIVEKKILLVAPEIPIYYPAAYGAQYVPPQGPPYQPHGNNGAPPASEIPVWAKEMVEGIRLLTSSHTQFDLRLRAIESQIGIQPPLRAPLRQPMPGAGNGDTGDSGHSGAGKQPSTGNPPNPSASRLAQLTPEGAGKVVDEVLNGRMPKGKPFTDADKILFLKDLSSGDEGRILARMTSSCASCHEKSVAASKGKGFILTER